MWHEQFTNKHNQTQYRFYEKYKDPYTDQMAKDMMNKLEKVGY
ncbi:MULTISPECIES: hypothetical protein [unclassified Staphylococcus]|nr:MULTISPECIES: hypothetical protein [unclassified Staphylococcus]